MKFSTIFLSFFFGFPALGQLSTPLPLRSSPHKTSIRQITGDGSLVSTKAFDFIVYEHTRSETPKKAFIQGGLHGNEGLASEFVMWLASRYETGESELNKIQAVSFDFVPYVNPDGTFFSSRLNSRRVNLNRNFGVLWGMSRENPGSAPFSEVETRAIKALFEKKKYDYAIDIHGFINWIIYPSEPANIPKELVQDRASEHRLLETVVKRHAPQNYNVISAYTLGDGGAFEDWAFWEKKIKAFCIELAYRQRFVMNDLEEMKTFLKNLTAKGLSPSRPRFRIDQFEEAELLIAHVIKDLL